MFTHIAKIFEKIFLRLNKNQPEDHTIIIRLNDGAPCMEIPLPQPVFSTWTRDIGPSLPPPYQNNAMNIFALINFEVHEQALGNNETNLSLANRLMREMEALGDRRSLMHVKRKLVHKALQNGQYGDSSLEWLEWLIGLNSNVDHHLPDEGETPYSTPKFLEYPRRPTSVMVVGTYLQDGHTLISVHPAKNPQKALAILRKSPDFNVDALDPENGFTALAHMILGYAMSSEHDRKDSFNERAENLLRIDADPILAIKTLLAFHDDLPPEGGTVALPPTYCSTINKSNWPPCIDTYLQAYMLRLRTVEISKENNPSQSIRRRL